MTPKRNYTSSEWQETLGCETWLLSSHQSQISKIQHFGVALLTDALSGNGKLPPGHQSCWSNLQTALKDLNKPALLAFWLAVPSASGAQMATVTKAWFRMTKGIEPSPRPTTRVPPLPEAAGMPPVRSIYCDSCGSQTFKSDTVSQHICWFVPLGFAFLRDTLRKDKDPTLFIFYSPKNTQTKELIISRQTRPMKTNQTRVQYSYSGGPQSLHTKNYLKPLSFNKGWNKTTDSKTRAPWLSDKNS